MTEMKPLPVKGYTSQSEDKVALVNRFKEIEERILRETDNLLERLEAHDMTAAGDVPRPYDPRWIAVARTHIQEGFMALNRAVFQPQRIKLPEDAE